MMVTMGLFEAAQRALYRPRAARWIRLSAYLIIEINHLKYQQILGYHWKKTNREENQT